MGIIFIEQRPIVVNEIVNGERVERTKIETSRRLISVATIQSALGYNSRITGISVREAQELAILLRAGRSCGAHVLRRGTHGGRVTW